MDLTVVAPRAVALVGHLEVALSSTNFFIIPIAVLKPSRTCTTQSKPSSDLTLHELRPPRFSSFPTSSFDRELLARCSWLPSSLNRCSLLGTPWNWSIPSATNSLSPRASHQRLLLDASPGLLHTARCSFPSRIFGQLLVPRKCVPRCNCPHASSNECNSVGTCPN